MADKTEKNTKIDETQDEQQEQQNPKNVDDANQDTANVDQSAKPEEDERDAKLKQLEDEIAGLKEKELRRLAEFDNFRKRTQKEKQDTYQNATADCVLNFLAVLDNLERALAAANDENQLKDGVSLIVSQFQDLLTKMGVEEIASLNETFDPVWHNAVNQVEDENYGENVICEVFQKGYRMGDKVIRPAMVVVANP